MPYLCVWMVQFSAMNESAPLSLLFEHHTARVGDLLRTADCVAIITNQRAFDYDRVVREAQTVVDTRNTMAHVLDPHGKITLL